MLKRVEIKGFKCLRDVSVELGPFNVLIGPNDSGKSSFLQALGEPQRWALGGRVRMPELSAPERWVRVWSETRDISLSCNAMEGLVLGLDGRVWGRPETLKRELAERSDEAFLRISEPLVLEPMAVARPSPVGSGVLAKIIESRGRGAAAHLARSALGDRRHDNVIQKAMRDITEGRVTEIVVGEHTEEGYPLSFRLYDNTIIPASEASQGLLVFFAFLCLVHRDDAPAVLLIEEPENGVHPLRVYEIVQLLRGLTEHGVQIIMTTHSPDLLNACKKEEVLVFRRPKFDSGTEIHRLPADFERKAMRETIGEVWAAYGEEGLLDILPKIEPNAAAEE